MGVPVRLVVRGICCLRPGIKGISENIEVTSIVDRFLEHSRIFVFGPDEHAKVFLSSADWMPANFYRRVEVMFPIESPPLRKHIINELLPSYLKDNVRARRLLPDGAYVRCSAKRGEPPFRCQTHLLSLEGISAAATPFAPPHPEVLAEGTKQDGGAKHASKSDEATNDAVPSANGGRSKKRARGKQNR